MMLLDTIKYEQVIARKSRDVIKTNILTTLIGEAVMIGKNDGNREPSDAEVVATIKKFVKNIDETLKITDLTTLHQERAILMDFLPRQLSIEELTDVVRGIAVSIGASSPKDVGKIMKVLKENYSGVYDGAAASGIVKSLF